MFDVDRVRALNDAARQTFTGCRVMMTQGVAALDCVDAVLAAVRSFSAFSGDNDPFCEHDFGNLQIDEHVVFWKFDYYDLSMSVLSSDPANPAVTVRVLTIMLADEY